MLSTFVESAPMKDLFERTIRNVPTGRFEAALRVRPSGSHSTVIQRATEYLVRNLVRRMAVEDGTDLLVGKLPAEARVRQAFPVPRFRTYLKDWCDHVNEARAVFKEFTDGGDVGRSRMATACQSMALLEILLQGDVIASARTFDPGRRSATVNADLLAIWDALDVRELLTPRSFAILHPQLARAGSVGTSAAALLVDGTLIDVTTRAEAALERDNLRLLAGKAAQARLGGVLPKGDEPRPVTVDRIALLYARHNRLLGFDVEELFGPGGWARYLEGFAELAGMEREMEPEGMSMMA